MGREDPYPIRNYNEDRELQGVRKLLKLTHRNSQRMQSAYERDGQRDRYRLQRAPRLLIQ